MTVVEFQKLEHLKESETVSSCLMPTGLESESASRPRPKHGDDQAG